MVIICEPYLAVGGFNAIKTPGEIFAIHDGLHKRPKRAYCYRG